MELRPQSLKPYGRVLVYRGALECGVEGGVQPLLSIQDLDGFHKRQEQEAIFELRKRAITRWLKQLPAQEDLVKPRTMWSSFQSFGDMDDSVRGLQRGRESRDLDGYNLTELSEETPIDDYEKKSLPSEKDHPIEKHERQSPSLYKTPVEGSSSVKMCGHDRRRRSDGASAGPQKAQFSKKWSLKGVPAVPEKLLEIAEQPLKSIEEALISQRQSSRLQGETSGSDGWSELSEEAEGDALHKEDTAYGGSHTGSRKHPSRASYKDKYGSASPVFAPPADQSIQPHTATEIRPMTPLDLKKPPKPQNEVVEGEWWLPNLFFKGFVGMVCNPGWMEQEEEESPSETELELYPMHQRVLRRLAHHRASTRRRSLPRLPPRGKLYLRMQQAKRAQTIRDQEVICELEHPFEMKAMVPSGSQTPHPLTPPQIRVMEYLPPASITDLSDFECYMGSASTPIEHPDVCLCRPMLSAFVQESHVEHPAVGHCQNWLLEKLLCFLGGRPTLHS